MNKKGFGIFPLELARIGVVIFLGIGLWFIYSSLKDWVIGTYGFSPLQSLLVGGGIVLVTLFLVKYKPQTWIFG